MTTTKTQPGEWYLVEGKPFQMPFRDRLGAAIKEGDEVLYAAGGKLRQGRILLFETPTQLVKIRDMEYPATIWWRPTSEVVLAR